MTDNSLIDDSNELEKHRSFELVHQVQEEKVKKKEIDTVSI